MNHLPAKDEVQQGVQRTQVYSAAGEVTYTTASGSNAGPGQRQLESSAAGRWWRHKGRNELQEKVVAVRSPQKRLGVVDLGASLFKQQSSFNYRKSSAPWLLAVLGLCEIL